MKKILSIFLFLILIVIGVIALTPSKKVSVANMDYEYFRIHIRANSNMEKDQKVKYQIKEKVVSYLTPYLCEVDSFEYAKEVAKELLDEVKNLCDEYLLENGFSYKANAEIKTEFFPTRNYDNVTLKEGWYESIIINLGEGVGNNWWCVVYPPLCFVNKNSVDEQDIVYRFKILEIIKRYFD